MREFIGYHCNEANVISSAVKNGIYNTSEGHSHWLGNGTYYFEEEPDGLQHAKTWGRRKKRPKIISNKIKVDDPYLVDLEKNEHKIRINNLKRISIKQILELANWTPNDGYIDGVFFNMWDRIFPLTPIHVIRKWEYYVEDIDYELKIRSRMDNAIVLCVREKECIVKPPISVVS
ncbi:hypothetical protein [Paenibacillus sp. GP183]|uniref:hypothetical protein n=1 Tax=Paenibacillus sp. GP183 TaxID=1882751 RepID=UPI0008952458|nr:hypothetical protein [Paenibacillus sp. GP183]SEC41094.1 hypothetical protein SAMN05443246_4010 [Paenibacillus sp. GP183]